MNQQTIHAVNQWAAQVQTALVKIAPVAWHTLVAVKQADSIGYLISGGAGLVFFGLTAIVAAIFMFVLIGKAAPGADDTLTGFAVFCFILGAIATLVSLGFAFALVTDYWIWIGAFHPDLAVAHDIIQKALGQ